MTTINDFSNLVGNESINNAILSEEFLHQVLENSKNNKFIAEYYYKYSAENTTTKKQRMFFYERADRVKHCNNVWQLDKYSKSKVKNFKKTYLCRDKFCSNCKKVKQAIRSKKFLKELVKYDEDLYFLTLTVPNASDVTLGSTIKKMEKSFSTLIRYLNGNLKIKGVDFKKFGYLGAVRSLEITYRTKEEMKNRFHPHFHAAIILKGYKPGRQYIQNKYSLDKFGKKDMRLFTNDEILLQKVWYLLNNGIEVNKSNLKEYKVEEHLNKGLSKGSVRVKYKKNPGYSVTLDKFRPGEYAEVFKYMIKDKDQDGNVMDYDTFKVFMVALNRVRQLQGYGVLYNVKDDEEGDEEIINEVENHIERFLAYLSLIEPGGRPVEVQETIEKVVEENDYTVITEKKLFNSLKIAFLKENITPGGIVEDDEKLSEDEKQYYYRVGKILKNEKEEKEKIINFIRENSLDLKTLDQLKMWADLVYRESVKTNLSYGEIIGKWGICRK